MKNISRKEKPLVLIGLSLILIGFLFNEWILTALFSPDGVVSLSYRIKIWIFNIICISFGYLIIRYRSLIISKLPTYYRKLATFIFSTFLLFVSINIFLYVALKISDLMSSKSNPVSEKYGLLLDSVYPGLSKESINELLIETWSRPYVYEPYTQFREKPHRSKFINIDENGFRYVKNQGPWPPEYNNFNIFLFGGSSTFGYGVSDDQTIASYLQEFFLNSNFREKVYIYNFGRGHYFCSQERILYEKLLTSGFIPNIAIFIDGLNEFYYMNDEPEYTNKFIKFVEGKNYLLLNLPIMKAINILKRKFSEKYKDGRNINDEKYKHETIITLIINRYKINKRLIEAVSKAFNVKSLFVWQPIPLYKYDLRFHIFADGGFDQHKHSKYGYHRMEKLSKRGELGDNFIWMADIQENLKKPLYVDKVHYSPEMSKIIAKNIYIFLMEQIIKRQN